MHVLVGRILDSLRQPDFTALFLDASLKSVAVVALAGGLSLGWRRASAATQHLIWFVAVSSLLLVPCVSVTGPSWRTPLWTVSTHFNSANQVSLGLEFPLARRAPAAHEWTAAESGDTDADQGSPGWPGFATGQISGGWLALALAAWSIGALLVLVRGLAARWRVRTFLSDARAYPADSPWPLLLRDLCQELDVGRSVNLMQSARPVMPVTWGWVHPVILLPAEADQWSAARRRVVLLHELGHVKRWDCFTQAITGVVCAAYWFNPLVWYAARVMRIERERACDDLTLRGGCRASDYATHLVAIAKGFRPVPPATAIGMGRASGLERRVEAVLDGRRCRNRPAKSAIGLIVTAMLGLEMLIGGYAAERVARVWSLDRSAVSVQLKHFVAEKEAQASAAAKADRQAMLPEYHSMFAAAAKGDWQSISNIWEDLRKRAPQYGGPDPKDLRLHGIQWETVKEIWGAFDNIVLGDDKYPAAFGKAIIRSIPRGSVYFGGTDPGRFLVTALCRSQVKGDPFFTLTQNALADESYLAYLRSTYEGKIYLPTDEDHHRCFQDYITDAERRLREHKLKPGEEVKQVGDKIEVGGQIAVMEVNGLLAKLIVEKNPGREFFIEESFPLDWMYPYLEPHGLILRINRRPLSELSNEIIQRDHAYWSKQVKRMLGGWLTYDSPLETVAAFARRVRGQHDLTAFQGDVRFVESDYARKMFSKLRSSSGGLYAWRREHAANDAEKGRMAREADFAFRQAWALCPYSPEAVFRYANLLLGTGRIGDARLVAETAAAMPSLQGVEGQPVRNLVEHLKRLQQDRGSPP